MNDEELKVFNEKIAAAKREVGKVIIGQSEVIELALITILTGSHALIEGVPGVAKTLLVRTLASVLSVESNRIQFTPDLMPADITGTNIFNMKTQEFTLVKGPVFTTFLLADEINRAPAKTQSALLQAMQERCVTIDREQLALDASFTVFATQNPIEHEGTYALPQAQQDRFMLKILMDYPEQADEVELAKRMIEASAPSKRCLVVWWSLCSSRVSWRWSERRSIRCSCVRICSSIWWRWCGRAAATSRSLWGGASGDAGAPACVACVGGSGWSQLCDPDDVKGLAPAVLTHRLMLRPEYEIEGLTVAEVVQQLLDSVPVPR